MQKFKSVWELKYGGEIGRGSRDKELEVGLRSETHGNFVKKGREFKYELGHKAVLADSIVITKSCFP